MNTKLRRTLILLLCISLIFCMSSPAYAVRDPGAGGGMGFFDGLDAFGNATATIGCVLNVGSVLANADWSDPGGVCLDLVDTIFGTSFGGDPMQETLDAIYSDVSEIKQTTAEIKQSVDYLVENSKYVNRQLSMINGSLRTINSQLLVQTHMLSQISRSIQEMNDEMTASFQNLDNLIKDSTKELKSVVYSSTAEIELTSEMNTALQSYKTNYSGIYSKNNIALEQLSAKEDYYRAFYNAITKLSNGKEVLEALGKITLDPASVSSLSARDQDLLKNTSVSVGGKSQQVLKFHQDFMTDLINYLTAEVYNLNGEEIGKTVLAMGDYLTGSNPTFNALGLGEMFYIYRTCFDENTLEVHREYKDFMDSMVSQYMTTAWLAEMSYGYKIAKEANGSNNAATIRQYEQYLNNIHAQMVKVNAYYDYEYQKCINNYDYGGNAFGHDQEVIYYGNTRSDGIWSVVKKNTINVPSGLSESSIELALGEEFDLHYYYRYAEVTSREGIVWSSSNPTVAAVDSRGEVLGLSRGVTKIKAEYMGTSAECWVSIGDVMAIANNDSVNRYHYPKYVSEQGTWAQKDLTFTVDSERGYDYYYGITTYITNTVELSEGVRSASIAETTGMTNANLDEFTWFTTGDGAVQLNGHEISAVTGGWTEVIGYKEVSENHTYDFIGIPVHSSMETLFKDPSVDYSKYTKISTAQDLINLANNPDGWGPEDKYVLTADIDLGGMEWNLIGYAFGLGSYTELSGPTQSPLGEGFGINVPFQGTFDGNGHTISNYKITKIPRTSEIEKAYKDHFNSETGNTLSDRAKTLGLADLGLFGYAFNANIIDLNVTDAVIDINTSNPTGITLDGTMIPYDETFTVFAGGLEGAGYWDPVLATYEYLDNKYSIRDDDVPFTVKMMNELYNEVEAPARFLNYYQDLEADDENYPDAPRTAGALIMAYALWESGMNAPEDQGMNGCYATGNIRITNQLDKGAVFAGLLAGASSSGFDQCTAIGSIDATASDGACGGLLGIQYAKPGAAITDCTSDVNVNALGGTASGGLLGELEGRFCMDINETSFFETDTVKETMDKAEAFEVKFTFAYILGGTFEKLSSNVENSLIKGNQVIGSVKGAGNTGGLIGFKAGYGDSRDLMVIMNYDLSFDSDGHTVEKMGYTHYNSDIICNYVACDVTSTGGSAGGLIGLADTAKKESTTSEPVTVKRGSVSKNYYSGKVNAGTGNAAGLVGMVNHEYSDLTQNISAATEIKGGGYQAYVINGRENGMPLVNGEGNSINVVGALAYNGLSNSVGDDGCTKGNDVTFDNPQVYTKIFGDDSFLDLTGGLRPDGYTGLDIVNGLIPKRLDNRYRFPTEKVPQNYHQGETFKPVTSVYKYTGTGMELITSGVKSTTPDMSKIGKQTVTLTYGNFKDTYDVYIYPSAGYLKITSMPAVEKTGKSISGGKIELYENGTLKKTLTAGDCTVTDKGAVFGIKYGNYTTALRPIIVNVYTNSFSEPMAEYVGTEFYAEGASADVSALVPSTRAYGGKTYKLGGTSQSTKFTATNDTYVLSYYGEEVQNSGDNNTDSTNKDTNTNTNNNTNTNTNNDTNTDSGTTDTTTDHAKQMGKDGTAFGKGASYEAVNQAITSKVIDSKDPKGTVFNVLKLKQAKVTKNSIKISWSKVKNAKKYVVYANVCGKTKFKKVKTTTGKNYTLKKVGKKKVQKGKYYKFMVVALDKNNNVLTTSKIVYIATLGGKYTNIKSLTTKAKKDKVTIKKGKTFKLGVKVKKASLKLKTKNYRKTAYETSNKRIATVTSKGVIKAKKKGTCYVYVYTQNGIFKKIKVTVKK